MYPLAQINFSEVPPLPGYPGSGYLQFYISADDEMYGLDFDDHQLQKNFRVLFLEEDEVMNPITDFSFLEKAMQSEYSPVFKPHSLAFTLDEEYFSVADFRYTHKTEVKLPDICDLYPKIEGKLNDYLYNNFSGSGHKIGGYATFAQTDPRENSRKFEDYILLLQIDSDKEIMWGDVGVGNLFIHPNNLLRKDFSKVMYNFDCY